MRGENHQTLRADEHKGHEDVIWMFIQTTEALAADEVDEMIEMDVSEELEAGLSRAVDGIVRVLGVERPTDEKIGEALRLAKTYAPQRLKQDSRKDAVTKEEGKDKKIPAKQRAPGKSPRYFGLLPEVDVGGVVGGRLAQQDVPPPAKAFWDGLKIENRITKLPHVTFVHMKSLPYDQALWDRCLAFHRAASPPSFRFSLGHIVYDQHVMAVTLEGLAVVSDEETTVMEAGADFLEKMPQDLQKCLHITIGTRDNSVNPYEAKSLVESWRNGENVSSIALNAVEGQGRVKGLFS